MRLPTETHTCLSLLQDIPFTQIYRRSFALFPALMGIVNVTPDSFSDGHLYYETDKACEHIDQLARDGASIIDIGGQSTRPQATPHLLTPEQEFQRIQPVLDYVSTRTDLSISLDSFSPPVIRSALNRYAIRWINDVSQTDDETLRLIQTTGAGIISMHALSIPVRPGESLSTEVDPCLTISNWAKERYAHLQELGFDNANIMLDPGIGFGKTPHQNVMLLRHVFHRMTNLGVQLLCGHSRKSLFQLITHRPPADRDLETATLCTLMDTPSYVCRVHNVADCQRALTTAQLIQPMILNKPSA